MFGLVRKEAVENSSMKLFIKYCCCDHVR